MLSLVLFFPINVFSQAYQRVWEENFNGTTLNTDIWNVENAVGIWNTGSNRELQHYRTGNVSVGPDGEGGNALIIEARREAFGGYQFTSGRINSSGNFAFRFGRVEARIKLPVLANGLWPAFWTLGDGHGWPQGGEIDVLEAGHLNGIARGQQDRLFNGTVHWEHNNMHVHHGRERLLPAGQSLYNYNIYILVWTPTRIEMFINQDPTPYFAMDITGADLEEFRDWAHYFILNIAVGGSFTGILTPAGITAPMPARMFVDWIRVYQRPGEGEFILAPGGGPVGPPPVNTRPTGEFFGIFTERANITQRFQFGDGNGHLYIWNNLVAMTGQTPREGGELLAFRSPGAGWCGLGIYSTAHKDLRHFNNGFLNFAVRFPANSTETIWAMMQGANNSEGRITFAPGSDPFGVRRDGNWHFVSVPISTLRQQGLDLAAVGNIFAAGSDNPTTGLFFDDVFLSVAPVNVPLTETLTDILKVFPNPANDIFTVQLNSVVEKLEVINTKGHVVFRKDNLMGETSIEINCSDWSRGLYLIRALGNNGTSSISKISVK